MTSALRDQHPNTDLVPLRKGSTDEHKAIFREHVAVSVEDLGAIEGSKFKETLSEGFLVRTFGSWILMPSMKQTKFSTAWSRGLNQIPMSWLWKHREIAWDATWALGDSARQTAGKILKDLTFWSIGPTWLLHSVREISIICYQNGLDNTSFIRTSN